MIDCSISAGKVPSRSFIRWLNYYCHYSSFTIIVVDYATPLMMLSGVFYYDDWRQPVQNCANHPGSCHPPPPPDNRPPPACNSRQHCSNRHCSATAGLAKLGRFASDWRSCWRFGSIVSVWLAWSWLVVTRLSSSVEWRGCAGSKSPLHCWIYYPQHPAC